jgi:hypothetical protein
MFLSRLKGAGQGPGLSAGRKEREENGGDDNEPPRTRRLAIKISEYETLEVQPYRKGQKKKHRKQNRDRCSRSPTPNTRSNQKKSAVFDYGNIYRSGGPLDEAEDFFTNSSVTSSAYTVSSCGSDSLPSTTNQASASTLSRQGEENRFISPIRSGGPREQNPLELKSRPRKEKTRVHNDQLPH